MANILNQDKQIAIIGALAEGSSIRSIERLTSVHRDTNMRLGVKVGKACGMLLDSKMQDLGCHYLQFDELWGFIGKKERHVRIGDDLEMGDVWTYCAIDAETKIVPIFKVGKRNRETTTAFVQDVANRMRNRMRNRVQISTDALHGYIEAVEQSFGADLDYGQIVKVYSHDAAHHPGRKYSAPSQFECKSCRGRFSTTPQKWQAQPLFCVNCREPFFKDGSSEHAALIAIQNGFKELLRPDGKFVTRFEVRSES